jgi:hypothetical protein
MQHLVIKHIPEKPEWNKWLVQCRIDPNHPIFFLNCAKDELFSRPMSSPAPPLYLVAPDTPAKMSPVQIIKDLPQIEMRTLVTQIQLLLHRQLRMRQFAFRRFLFSSHFRSPKTKRD